MLAPASTTRSSAKLVSSFDRPFSCCRPMPMSTSGRECKSNVPYQQKSLLCRGLRLHTNLLRNKKKAKEFSPLQIYDWQWATIVANSGEKQWRSKISSLRRKLICAPTRARDFFSQLASSRKFAK